MPNLTDRKTVADFLEAHSSNNINFRLNCDYEVEFCKNNTEITTIFRFLCQTISTPAFRINTGQIYFHGKPIEVPLNYEFDSDFDLTLYDLSGGLLYKRFIEFIHSPDNFNINNEYTIKIYQGYVNNALLTTLYNVIIKNISGLTFSNNDVNVASFSLNCATTAALDPNIMTHYLDGDK